MMQVSTAFRYVHDVHEAWQRGWETTFCGDTYPRRVPAYKAPTGKIELRIPEQRGGRPYQVPQTARQLRWRCQMIRHYLIEDFDGAASLDAHLTGSKIVAIYKSPPSAPHPYKAAVLWNENSGLRELDDLAADAIDDEAYRGLKEEVVKHYFTVHDLTDKLIDELLADARELVDQYGIDAYEAGKQAVRELLQAYPELKYDIYDRKMADRKSTRLNSS